MKTSLLILIILISNTVYASSDFLKTLTELLKNDPEYQEVQNQKIYQETVYKAAKSDFALPSVDLTFSKVDEKTELGGNSFNYETGGLNFSLSLFRFGADYADLMAKKYGLKSYQSLLKANLIERETIIVNKLLEYISINEVLMIQKEILSLKSKLFKISQKRFTKGGLSRDDLQRVEIDYLNSSSEVISSEQTLLDTASSLASFGLETYSSLAKFPWAEKFQTNKVKKLITFKNDHKLNPSLARLQAQFESKNQALSREKRSHFGRVTLDYSRTYAETENSNEQFGQRASLNLVIPIFEKFSQQKNVELARAEVLTVKSYLDFEKNQLIATEKALKKRFQFSFKNLEIRRKTLYNAERIFKNSVKQFRRGSLSANDLLIEQDRYLSTKLLTNKALYTIHLDYMNLLHLFGMTLTENEDFL